MKPSLRKHIWTAMVMLYSYDKNFIYLSRQKSNQIPIIVEIANFKNSIRKFLLPMYYFF